MTDKPFSCSQTIIITVMLFLFMSIAGAHVGAQYDINYWITWSSYIFEHGLSEAYDAYGNDYMPIFQYLLYVFGKMQGSLKMIEYYVGYLKAFPIALDMIGLWYVYRFIDKKTGFLVLLLVNMLNFGFSYNSFVWEQFDGVFSTLNFIAVYYAWKRKMILSVVFFVLSFNVKVQAVILFPVIGFFYLEHIIGHKTWKAVLLPLLSMAVLQFIILIPFINSPKGVSAVWDVVASSVGRYPMVTLQTCNFWTIIFPGQNLSEVRDDNLLLGGMTYKTVGLLLFFISSFAALFPLLKQLVLRVAGKATMPVSSVKLVLICALLYISFYFFNTQMHERYCHPAMIFLIAFSFLTSRYFVYILFSIAYFLTLERLHHWMPIQNYKTFVFNDVFIAYLNLVILAYAFYMLYRKEEGTDENMTIVT